MNSQCKHVSSFKFRHVETIAIKRLKINRQEGEVWPNMIVLVNATLLYSVRTVFDRLLFLHLMQ